jgi:hypothetical protein
MDPTTHLQRPAERETLVSVVLPTFNRAPLLRLAVESVLEQTWSDLEVVIVDDGSTDDTPGLLQELSRADDRVRAFRQANGGVSAARNAALAQCRGAFIAFLDSDDAWHCWKLKAQVEILRQLSGVGMVWSDMNAIDTEGRVFCDRYLRKMYKGYQRFADGQLFERTALVRNLAPTFERPLQEAVVSWGRIYSHMLLGNLVHTSTVVMTRERAALVGPFDESMKRGGEDYKFHLATTRNGPVAFLDAPTIRYRVGADDQITNAGNQVHFAASFLRTLEEELAKYRHLLDVSERGISEIRADAHDWLAWALVEAGQRRQAAGHALRAIRQRPGTRSAWKTLAKSLLPQSAVDLVRAARRVTTGSTTATM